MDELRKYALFHVQNMVRIKKVGTKTNNVNKHGKEKKRKTLLTHARYATDENHKIESAKKERSIWSQCMWRIDVFEEGMKSTWKVNVGNGTTREEEKGKS